MQVNFKECDFNSIPLFVLDTPLNVPLVNSEENDILYPVDAQLNQPSSDTARLISPYISEDEKTQILSRLKRNKGVYADASLSDDDIMAIIPSRYMNSPENIKAYFEMVDRFVSSVASSVDVSSADASPADASPADTPSNDAAVASKV